LLISTVFGLVVAVAAAVPVAAQAPYVNVYTDPTLQDPHIHCGAAGTLEELFVVLHNVDFVVSAIDFQIGFPPSMTWLFDLPPAKSYPGTEQVTIGNSRDGIAVAWATCCMPDGSLGPIIVLRPVILWSGPCDCQTLLVEGYQPLGKTSPSFVRGSDFQE